ncbi:HEAT repeat domain-containing protein [Streptomyces scabiei]|uniref:HEAT repeat domain-containing protein n=1 Tax=Streptomyces scabiei TaxID=1930 RepID=UPI001B300DA3|nr:MULTISPECIES: HEAT repeat domain-containing protein [Streptomyces]MBP5860038.1 HEAT repeat domain-containing protein [Streptomyces sp. LBUM 1484]MBP5879664.1 HEAT repeat domain-containing protein [Streptomyces sp. LBUM 1477]MBP5903491.1 HEAT repeat domain-containing protein [Streptomyces sp. LBUM 1488]MDW8477131.1 HEAT repeat domain-containing protein [Streptomyces scabiei]MDX2569870.1 HEAT repeat domain-containing protein [Streptomyces scabiei]
MLTGIDDVDWASMGHAYTDSATDVPDLLRGLASDDPAERDLALDSMYGAVHHQGDVYGSTVACIPFLFELASREGLADRAALVHLLCSIGGDGEEKPDPEEVGGLFEDEEEDAAYVRPFLDAWEGVRARADVFLGLLADPDPEVRAAAAAALALVHPDPARAFTALSARLPHEREAGAQLALVDAVGELAVRHGEDVAERAGPVLGAAARRDDCAPEARLTALDHLAHGAPGSLPEDTAEIAVEVLGQAYERRTSAAGTPGPTPERPRTPTLVSHLRELEAARHAEADADETHDILRRLHRSLGDRTDIRFPLLIDQLGSPDRERRLRAIAMCGEVLRGWRARDDEPVTALARQLREPDLGLCRAALGELRDLAPITGAVTDEVVDFLMEFSSGTRGDEQGLSWDDMAFGRAIDLLALQGDERMVNAVRSAVGRLPEPPAHLQRWLRAFDPGTAAELGPVLHDRLAALGPDDRSATGDLLVGGLGLIAHAESLDLLVGRLRASGGGGTARRCVLRALSRYGEAAAGTAPLLRELTREAEPPDDRLPAAHALWATTGDTATALPALRSGLESGDRAVRDLALRLLGSLGPAAAPLGDVLRTADATARAAIALWQVTADTEAALPRLLHHWTADPGFRPSIAACLAEMGAAAAPALPLLRAELASPRRHHHDGSADPRQDITADEELLRDCRRTVTVLESGAGTGPEGSTA